MDQVLATIATPFYVLLDFALDTPGLAAALATGVGMAIAIVLLAA